MTVEEELKEVVTMLWRFSPAIACLACVITSLKYPEGSPELIVIAYLAGMWARSRKQ